MFPPPTPHILYTTRTCLFPIPCMGHALGISRSVFRHSLCMILRPFPPNLRIKSTFIFQSLAIKPLQRSLNSPESDLILCILCISTHILIVLVAIHFRSLTLISRQQVGFPKPLRSRGDWLRAFHNALGKPKPPQGFCHFRGVYVSCTHLLPGSYFHTSCLCSLMVSEAQLKAYVFLSLLPPLPSKNAPKHSHQTFLHRLLQCGCRTGGPSIARIISTLALRTGHPWRSQGHWPSQTGGLHRAQHPLSHLPQANLLVPCSP